MLQFYFSLAPNPMKVALFLEEAGLPYEAIPVNTRKGDQHAPAFMALNPNAKVPVIVDGDAVVFDSNAILIYLGQKTGQFMPAYTPKARGEMLSWMMFIASGIGPYSGQAVHFTRFAPEPREYGATRYTFEARRHFAIVEARLADHAFMLGDHYTIVDMALWGWARLIPFVLGEETMDSMPNLKRLIATINARPATERAIGLKDKHVFEVVPDDVARQNMFRHLVTAA